MNCPICHHTESKVVRSADKPSEVRRRRRCCQCGHTWPTVEQPEAAIEQSREVVAKARELAELVKEG